MTTTIAAGRQLARRAAVWQAVVLSVLALAFLPKGGGWALAAVVGGGAVAVGNWISGAVALGGGVGPAAGVLGRLLAGMVLKWALVIAALVLGAGVGGLPPLAILSGVVAALVVQVLALARR